MYRIIIFDLLRKYFNDLFIIQFISLIFFLIFNVDWENIVISKYKSESERKIKDKVIYFDYCHVYH